MLKKNMVNFHFVGVILLWSVLLVHFFICLCSEYLQHMCRQTDGYVFLICWCFSICMCFLQLQTRSGARLEAWRCCVCVHLRHSLMNPARWRRTLSHRRTAAWGTALCRDHRHRPGPETGRLSRSLQTHTHWLWRMCFIKWGVLLKYSQKITAQHRVKNELFFQHQMQEYGM